MIVACSIDIMFFFNSLYALCFDWRVTNQRQAHILWFISCWWISLVYHTIDEQIYIIYVWLMLILWSDAKELTETGKIRCLKHNANPSNNVHKYLYLWPKPMYRCGVHKLDLEERCQNCKQDCTHCMYANIAKWVFPKTNIRSCHTRICTFGH